VPVVAELGDQLVGHLADMVAQRLELGADGAALLL